jgi:hypothetical protein
LALGPLGEIPVEEDEEALHLGLESLWARTRQKISKAGPARTRSLAPRIQFPTRETHLLVVGVVNLLDHGVELVAHSLGRDAGCGRLEVLLVVRRERWSASLVPIFSLDTSLIWMRVELQGKNRDPVPVLEEAP